MVWLRLFPQLSLSLPTSAPAPSLHLLQPSALLHLLDCCGRMALPRPSLLTPRGAAQSRGKYPLPVRYRRPLPSSHLFPTCAVVRPTASFLLSPTCSAVVPFLPSEIAVLLLLLLFSAVSLLVWASSCSSFSFRLPVYPLRWQLPKALRAPLSHYGRPLSSPPVPLKPQPPRG